MGYGSGSVTRVSGNGGHMETSGHRTGGEREVPQPSRLKAASARGKECRLGGEGPENKRRRGRGRWERAHPRGVDKWGEADGRGPEGERGKWTQRRRGTGSRAPTRRRL